MNKYLLLRDNKQSGPYTVPEIIELGIKPYDLVWLEGKSAAWRYPSEVEELKAYSPAVEEQPFDRFYKKPQAKISEPVAPAKSPEPVTAGSSANNQQNHERYQPRLTNADTKPNKKVYINFPAGAPASAKTVIENSVKESASANPVREIPVAPVVATSQSTINDSWTTRPDENFSSQYQNSNRRSDPANADRKLAKFALAACIGFGLISGVLIFNYFRQQQELKNLNSLVQQIEDSKRDQQAVNTSLVQQPTPVEPAQSVPVDENSASAPNQTENTVPNEIVDPPSVNAVPSHKTAVAIKKKEAVESDASAVTFQEKGRPVERRDDATPVAPATEQPAQNLFKLVDVQPNSYKTGLLGGISNLKFELTNKSGVELQRVAVEVKYLGPEKKVVKKQTIYFENVSPGAQSTVEVPKSNRGVSIEYTITDIKS